MFGWSQYKNEQKMKARSFDGNTMQSFLSEGNTNVHDMTIAAAVLYCVEVFVFTQEA